ncbi:TPA: methyltransferase [Yersinia enterocolitica]|uniref:class I SAM-dependent methyltransferase n=1 Tax=Yersinia enterocolitica TaxID=630 RepID=UPI0029B729F2|nr:methyltransferase [Yersinia enterocolitica]EMA9425887.1 methyltransferase [Yersinia enterocolitica]EMA9428678.1 methyltransferase [Yersinia enterocolitica]HDL7801964.1 methyltransferase [Yersinia enterocolitica]HDL7805738.1 methyltransferase [Yersinia enterocolitica]
MLNTVRRNFKSQFSYLQRFIASPRTVGTLAPSSPWLCQAMLNQVDWKKSLNIAELGAADGVLTKRILSYMSESSRLQAYEIQPHFVHSLHQINDSRLQVAFRSAEQLDQDYDVVFCCLPLLSIPTKISIKILQQAQQRLRANQGVLVLFQYSHLSEPLLSRYFTWKKIRVVRNFPPALVYICQPR